MKTTIQTFVLEGTSNGNSEMEIRGKLINLDGVKKVEFNSTNSLLSVTFDPTLTKTESIAEFLEKMQYNVFEVTKKNNISKTFVLEGLISEACETRISKEVLNLKGIESVEIDHVTSLLKVTSNPKMVSSNDITRVVTKLNYEVLGEVGEKNESQSAASDEKKSSSDIVNKTLIIDGMTCAGCESKIERKVSKMDGVQKANANYSKGLLKVTFDAAVISIDEITKVVEKLHYSVLGENNVRVPNGGTKANIAQSKDNFSPMQLLQVGVVIFAIYLLINNTVGFNFIPKIDQNTSFGLLFVIGLITSIHCIAMCGGINLSQSISKNPNANHHTKFDKLKPSLMYNMGRVVSYTVIGGIVGALGSVISLSGTGKALVSIVAGVFMVIMGLNLMNVFPWLRKFNLTMPKFIANKIHSEKGGRGPFVVGLLNGMMPCGPLQSMQIFALSTGSFLAGATAMFLFSLGTVPLMLGLGALSSMLTAKFTKRMMTVSAFLVIILGVVMLNRGLGQTGFAFGDIVGSKGGTAYANAAKINGNVQEVTTSLGSGSYEPITVQKGIPVKWTIKAKASDINGCNEKMVISDYNIEKTLQAGDNVIEFTPDKSGTIPYSCWMGMINSKITVVDDLGKAKKESTSNVNDEDNSSNGDTQSQGGLTPIFGVANLTDGKQTVDVDVVSGGYSPNVFIVQKGVKTKFHFNVKSSSCAAYVTFPQGQQADVTSDPDITITPTETFQFQCSMGMYSATVIVVDKLDESSIKQVKDEVNANPSQYVSQGGGGCCGG